MSPDLVEFVGDLVTKMAKFGHSIGAKGRGRRPQPRSGGHDDGPAERAVESRPDGESVEARTISLSDEGRTKAGFRKAEADFRARDE